MRRRVQILLPRMSSQFPLCVVLILIGYQNIALLKVCRTGFPTPYSFQHHLSLTKNVAQFQGKIRSINSTYDMPSNVDSPESGLDAMAQAMLCPDVVGWRNGDVR